MTDELNQNFGSGDSEPFISTPEVSASDIEAANLEAEITGAFTPPNVDASLPQYGAYGEQPIAPVASEPTPWVNQPAYGQYAQGGAPGYGVLPTAPPVAYASKPGIIPLRPLRLGEIFDGAFGAIRANPAVMLGLSALVIAGATLIGWALGQLLGRTVGVSLFNPLFNEPEIASLLNDDAFTAFGLSGANVADTTAQFMGQSLGMGLTMAIASPILAGILTIAVSQSVIGKKLTIGEVWNRVAPRIGALLAWTLLSAIAVFAAVFLAVLVIVLLSVLVAQVSEGFGVLLGLFLGLALALLAFWVAVKLIFVPVVIVLENASVGQAIRRSWQLTRGHFWRLFGIYLLSSILVSIVSSLITTPLSLLGGIAGAGGFLTVSIISSIISTLVTSIFMAGVVSLLYIDTRMRSEGLGDSLAAAAQNSGTLAF